MVFVYLISISSCNTDTEPLDLYQNSIFTRSCLQSVLVAAYISSTGHRKSTFNILYVIYCFIFVRFLFPLHTESSPFPHWSFPSEYVWVTVCLYSQFRLLATCWSPRTVPSQCCAAICLQRDVWQVWERAGAEWRAEVGLTSTCCQDWAG